MPRLVICDNGVARTVQRLVICDNGVAREVKRALICDNGVAREFWSSAPPPPVDDLVWPTTQLNLISTPNGTANFEIVSRAAGTTEFIDAAGAPQNTGNWASPQPPGDPAAFDVRLTNFGNSPVPSVGPAPGTWVSAGSDRVWFWANIAPSTVLTFNWEFRQGGTFISRPVQINVLFDGGPGGP